MASSVGPRTALCRPRTPQAQESEWLGSELVANHWPASLYLSRHIAQVADSHPVTVHHTQQYEQAADTAQSLYVQPGALTVLLMALLSP